MYEYEYRIGNLFGKCFSVLLSKFQYIHISSFLFVSAHLRVNLGLILRKNPVLVSVWLFFWIYFILKNIIFLCKVMKIPIVFFCLKPYLSWDTLCVCSSLKERYIWFVTSHLRKDLKTILYSSFSGMSLLCIILT